MRRLRVENMKLVKLHPYAASAGLLILVGSILSYFAFPSIASPLPKDIESYDVSVEEGRYLATLGNCATCHTAEGGQPFAGGVELRTPFGVLYSTNITMDEETGIGSWTFENFYQAMKQGTRPDGTHLYPAFPYTSFAKMTDEDIASLYLYMKTVEPVNIAARPNNLKFPYNLRVGLYAWKKLFHDSGTYTPDVTQSDEWNRGAYLVKGPGHCGACHTPRNVLGAERDDLELAGGVYLDEVENGNFRDWSAVNLTPAQNGLAAWSVETIIAYLHTGISDMAIVYGPMNKVVINSTRHLNDADIRAIAIYLKGIPANAQDDEDPPPKESYASSENIYIAHCGTCHLPSGLGDPNMGVPIAGSVITLAEDPSSLINLILYGAHSPVPPFIPDRARMQMLGKKLSDKNIANILTYTRINFGNNASAVTSDQVKKQR